MSLTIEDIKADLQAGRPIEIVVTRPLNAEQREMVDVRYMRVRDWCEESARFEFRDERVAGWISDDT